MLNKQRQYDNITGNTDHGQKRSIQSYEMTAVREDQWYEIMRGSGGCTQTSLG